MAGTLAVGSNVLIRTAWIRVEATGTFTVGSEAQPASNVTIYLEHTDCQLLEDGPALDACLVRGQLLSFGTTRIWGMPKTSWTWLSAQATSGASAIEVDDCAGWVVGDWIVLGPTGHNQRGNDRTSASETYVASVSVGVSSCTVSLTGSLVRKHDACDDCHGVRKYAEVCNMNRSVEITGPFYSRDHGSAERDPVPQRGGQGVVTSQRHTGVMTMHHVHVSNCGRIVLGEYCLHLHILGVCPACRFEGVVVTRGVNKALVFHATHQASAQDFIAYDHKGA